MSDTERVLTLVTDIIRYSIIKHGTNPSKNILSRVDQSDCVSSILTLVSAG